MFEKSTNRARRKVHSSQDDVLIRDKTCRAKTRKFTQIRAKKFRCAGEKNTENRKQNPSALRFAATRAEIARGILVEIKAALDPVSRFFALAFITAI
ncbi:MAG: hypothetical protein ACLQSR_03840 [Limisphaerales bacterium]